MPATIRAICSIEPAAPSMFEGQHRGQQMATAEHVQRQVAIAVVVAVEEPSLLASVQGIVGRVEIENDLLGRTGVRLQEQIDKHAFDRRRVVADLVIARRCRPAQFQPVQCALARQRRAIRPPRLKLARQRCHHRVVAQMVVIVQVLVAKRNPEHPLADQGRDLVFDQSRAANVLKALRKPARQVNRNIRQTQQHCSGIGRNPSTVERRHNGAPFDPCKSK